MTKPTFQKKKRKKKFNPIHLGGIIHSRKEAVDTEYVNGVYDSSGKQVMRALTKDEKEWLTRFYNEEINATFESSDKSERLRKRYKKLKKQHKGHFEAFKEHHPDVVQAKKEFEAELEVLSNFNSTIEDRSAIYERDNNRRTDLMTVARTSGALVNFDLNEYDKFTYKACKDQDPEQILIQVPMRKKEPR